MSLREGWRGGRRSWWGSPVAAKTAYGTVRVIYDEFSGIISHG